MKKISALLICCLIVSGILVAQGGKSVFLEFGGNGLGFSVNYDARFTKIEKGPGFRAGVGVFPGLNIGNNGSSIFSWPTILSIPVGVNYLFGKAPNYFEAGLGTTYFYAKGHFTFFFLGTDGTLRQFVFIPSAGYRFAKPGKAFQGRVCISPYIIKNRINFYVGASCGYKF
jgi:hypothetical protein